jgi:hypothetical protein
MLHFTETTEPKIAPRHHPLLERFTDSFTTEDFGLYFSPVPQEDDELLRDIDDEIQARQMTLEDLQEQPDIDTINQFLDGALDEFRKDGIDYAEE